MTRNNSLKTVDPIPEPAPFGYCDPLTQVLDTVRLRFMMPSAHEFTAPWGVRFGGKPADFHQHLKSLGLPLPPFEPPKASGSLIAIIRGNCWLDVEEFDVQLALAGSDVVLLTRDADITLRDDPHTSVKHIRDVVRREDLLRRRGVRYGGGGAACMLLSGKFFFEDQEDNPLLSTLPPVIHVRGADSEAVPWLEANLRFLNHELLQQSPGGQCIANHLAHVLFVQAVRVHAASLPAGTAASWLQGAMDPELAPALGLIHLRPQEPWTVASLAEQSNASRSAFAARFTARIGQPPLQYLAEYRMRLAKTLLRESKLGMKTIAQRVGYANESAFGAAFKRQVGLAPGAYRASVAVPLR